MIIKSDLDMCRNKLQCLIGKRVRLTSNGGRKRIITYEGIVENCYNNVFTVRCERTEENDCETVSYSYVDVLTKAVRISIPSEASVEVAS